MAARPPTAPIRATTIGNVTTGKIRNRSPPRNAMRRTTTTAVHETPNTKHSRRSLSIRITNAAKRSKSGKHIHRARATTGGAAPTERRLRETLRHSLRRLSLSERPRKMKSSPPPRINVPAALMNSGERAKVYMAAADEAARVGDIIAAQEHLRDVLRNCIDISPHTTAEVLALLGIVADRLGQSKDAEILLNESLGKSGEIQSFVPLFVLGNIYQRTGRTQEANNMFKHGEKFRKFLVQ